MGGGGVLTLWRMHRPSSGVPGTGSMEYSWWGALLLTPLIPQGRVCHGFCVNGEVEGT